MMGEFQGETSNSDFVSRWYQVKTARLLIKSLGINTSVDASKMGQALAGIESHEAQKYFDALDQKMAAMGSEVNTIDGLDESFKQYARLFKSVETSDQATVYIAMSDQMGLWLKGRFDALVKANPQINQRVGTRHAKRAELSG